MLSIELNVKDVFIIKPVIKFDDRGEFYESFNRETYHAAGIYSLNVAQINHSISKKNVLRGLHYQAGHHAQGKVVWVTEGSVYDVYVDLRIDSPTYGQWGGVELSSNNKNRLYIPKGCAHGFLALEPDTEFNYICTNSYNKESERTLIWNDPKLNITWPTVDGEYIISPKDKDGVSFDNCEKFNIIA